MRRRTYLIALDVHSSFCEGGYIDESGREKGAFRTPTSIPELLGAIEKVPRPRKLVMEEGPLADWLIRHLQDHVEELVSCDPYRNALISRDGDKDDGIDWRKLAQLYRGGYVRAVHHPLELGRSLFKQRVQMYHDRVRHRVSEGLKIIWRVRRLGVFIKQKDLIDAASTAAIKAGSTRIGACGLRKELMEKLPAVKSAREDVALLLEGYDLAVRQVKTMKSRLIESSKSEPMVRRFCELPGVSWVRAATVVAFIDTPYRFKSKQKLWKYMGIGLEKRQSGKGRVQLRVPNRCSRVLKNVILGAAKSAVASKDNVFADLYERWLNDGCSPQVARRNVARSLAAVMWGMWKSSSVFDPKMICKTLVTAS
jgi:transposase